MKSTRRIKILEVYPVEAYRLELTFSNNKTYIVDFEPLLEFPAFASLKDLENFKQFALVNGTLEWKENVDIAPEFLHKLARKQVSITT